MPALLQVTGCPPQAAFGSLTLHVAERIRSKNGPSGEGSGRLLGSIQRQDGFQWDAPSIVVRREPAGRQAGSGWGAAAVVKPWS